MRIVQSTPYLRVANMQRSLAFYVDGLGFEVASSMEAEDGLFWARIERDACVLVLSHRASRFLDGHDDDGEHEHDAFGHHIYRANGVQNGELNCVTYIYVEDVDAAYDELRGRGVETVDAPEDKFYGLREFLLSDPDGYYYAVAQLTGQ